MSDDQATPDGATSADDLTTEATEDNSNTSSSDVAAPMAAWFLGPKAEHGLIWQDLFTYVFQDYVHWRRNYFPSDPVLISRHRQRTHENWLDELTSNLDLLLNKLKADFPFYSPRYLAHMLSEQTLPSVLGYYAGMLYNPNNVTEEAAPVTVQLELEVGRMVSEMLGFRAGKAWAHITSGGTVANLEALWVARTVQFIPLALRELCSRRRLQFKIKTADGLPAKLRDLDDDALLHLRPNEAIFMPRRLASYLANHGAADSTAANLVGAHLLNSRYNVAQRGYAQVAGLIGRVPRVYVTRAHHYSIAKACNILGYGEDALVLLPVTDQYRLDVGALEAALREAAPNTYTAGVIGVIGTTEEGAVDPIHEIVVLRDNLASSLNRSFWLHLDAAWGGYLCSLFRGHHLPRMKGKSSREIAVAYAQAIDAREQLTVEIYKRKLQSNAHGKQRRKAPKLSMPYTRELRHLGIAWGDPDLCTTFLAVAAADSITVDPHKLGYTPYPAGIVAFRNGLVTELITQKAPYISDAVAGTVSIDEPGPISAVGPYILEGSKPGAAASSCWLAHTAIPLNSGGHGQIMRSVVLSARKLALYFNIHRDLYRRFEIEAGRPDFEGRPHHFTFFLLTQPDTNIVCFVARQMSLRGGELTLADCPLAKINALNRQIYDRLGRPSAEAPGREPYLHPFFLSRTTFEADQYPADTVGETLRALGVAAHEYEASGLFVLRSTVMNPHYHLAEAEAPLDLRPKVEAPSPTTIGTDYLFGFVRRLHETARSVVEASWQ